LKEPFSFKKITEYEAAQKLHSIRQQDKYFVSESFPTISSSGSNAAIIH